jgi:hypothetical protein
MTHSLTGQNQIHLPNLKGTTINNQNQIPIKIKQIQERILAEFLIPILSNQWNIVSENMFLIERIQKSISFYHNTYKLDELLIYIELLKAIQILMDNTTNNSSNNNNVGNTNSNNTKDVVSLLFKTAKIRLRPEYEIYNSVFGKPNKELKQTYNINIIKRIQDQLNQENITFKKIKENIMASHFEN